MEHHFWSQRKRTISSTSATQTDALRDAAVAEAELRIPESDPGHEDDTKCLSPKQKCSDCGRKLEMCTTGVGTRCACESTSCPTGNQQPKCSDPKCKGGKDKNYSADDQGCDCTEEKCPSGKDTLFCDDCGGADQNNKCKGVSRCLSSLKTKTLANLMDDSYQIRTADGRIAIVSPLAMTAFHINHTPARNKKPWYARLLA